MRKENSTNSINEKILTDNCNAYKTLRLFGSRWKLSILFMLNERATGYAEFKDSLVNISDRILSKQLNELIQDNIIEKNKTKVSASYSLTKDGSRLVPILLKLSEFSREAK